MKRVVDIALTAHIKFAYLHIVDMSLNKAYHCSNPFVLGVY